MTCSSEEVLMQNDSIMNRCNRFFSIGTSDTRHYLAIYSLTPNFLFKIL